MEIGRIRLLRDLYYIADKYPSMNEPLADYEFNNGYVGPATAKEIDFLLSEPGRWAVFTDIPKEEVEFELGEGEFLALGDNSGESRDSRLWDGEGIGPEVPRDLLIGKALFIYWPHSQNRIPGTNIPFPFFPNFKRMWVIR